MRSADPQHSIIQSRAKRAHPPTANATGRNKWHSMMYESFACRYNYNAACRYNYNAGIQPRMPSLPLLLLLVCGACIPGSARLERPYMMRALAQASMAWYVSGAE